MDDCANAQYPPITGKLREKLAEYEPTEGKCNLITRAVGSTGYARLVELCDTIDAIHARLEAAYDHLRAERDSMAAALDRVEGEHDYAPESHYVMLPKDADGEPVHIGDVMEWPDGETFEVVGIGGDTLFYAYDDDYAEWTVAHTKRHHHAPTVEYVLREFFSRYVTTKPKEEDDAIIAEYAAKLRLAGDAE